MNLGSVQFPAVLWDQQPFSLSDFLSPMQVTIDIWKDVYRERDQWVTQYEDVNVYRADTSSDLDTWQIMKDDNFWPRVQRIAELNPSRFLMVRVCTKTFKTALSLTTTCKTRKFVFNEITPLTGTYIEHNGLIGLNFISEAVQCTKNIEKGYRKDWARSSYGSALLLKVHHRVCQNLSCSMQ